MCILKPLCIAFSIYSKIPVLQFDWEEKDMKYMLCFFPWIGIVIGVLVFGWFAVADKLGIGSLGRTLLGAVIPLLVTGGFHVDGFMDTMDTFHSYQPKEKKLEILKDPHIGAFSVIMLAVYGLLFLGALSELQDTELIAIVCAGFVVSRVLSGLGVVSISSAKKDGLLFTFANNAHKNRVKTSLYVQGILTVLFMLWQSLVAGGIVTVTALGMFLYYERKCKKELGGITGDTAGYFVCICELGFVMVSAVIGLWR